ncbi:MAG: hypothetical protein MK171_02170 [Pirellulales bacterium]|nr:hypothetical protein [Pirellulales bacterium]
MASVTEKHPATPQPAPVPEAVVDQQIQRTRRTLKSVDATVGLLTLVIGVLAFLLTAAVLDHWVLPGGWSPAMRIGLFAVLVLGIVWYSLRVLWPLVHVPINPVFAAQAIEQSSPSLKNSLLNLLLLRDHKRQMQPQVYLAIEAQAAQRLANVPTDTAVDRSAILRLGYVLVAMVALCTLYRIISPKDPLASAARVLLPWSEIAAPSRVQILTVAPGSTSLARGEQLPVSVEVLGLDEDEPVRLVYTTADEQQVDQIIPMRAAASRTHFECRLANRQLADNIAAPPRGGVQQALTYWIEAGDARSPRFEVSVFARPTLVVTGVHYEYPDYTGYPARDVEFTGDIRAIEGSRVTLVARANKPIDAAHVDFEADGKRDLLMQSDNQQATVTFPLSLKDDRRTPRYRTYVLRYLTAHGRKNLSPPKYQIDVIPDYSPEVQLLMPEESLIDVKLNAPVEFQIEARDPDFAVRDVTLFGEVGGELILQQKLLTSNHTGRFVGKFRKTPAELGLHVGDVMDYWAAAADNRRPTANVSQTVHHRLRVMGGKQADTNEEQDRQSDAEEAQLDEGQDKGAGEGEGSRGEATGASEDGGEGLSGAGASGDGQRGQSDSSEGGGAGGESAADQEVGAGESQPGEGNAANASSDSGEDSGNRRPGERGDDRESENQGNPGKVSAEGDDDGAAFDRMAEHFRQQRELGEETEGAGQTSDSEQAGEGDSLSKASEGPDDNRSTNKSSSAGQNDLPEGDSDSHPQQTEGGQEEGSMEKASRENGGEEDGGEQSSPDGHPAPEQDQAGAGENPGANQGVPESDVDEKPGAKTPDPATSGSKPGQESSANSKSQTESDSNSNQNGDRSGSGTEGAGQQEDAEGTGSSGEHQATDEGGGKASESDQDKAGSQSGDGQPSRGKKGKSSENQPGSGTESGDAPGNTPQGDDPAGDSTGESAEDNGGGNGNRPAPSQQGQQGQANVDRTSESSAGDKPPPESGQPSQGETAPASQDHAGGGTGGNTSPPPGSDVLPGDEANLEYARQQTDLVLERIEDQLDKKQVDHKLLEKLGWSQDELQRFVDRWKSLKSKAAGDNRPNTAKKELDDSLRRLGLLPKSRLGYRSQITKDRLRDLRDTYRGRTPLEYQDRLRAYVKGTASEGQGAKSKDHGARSEQ